MGECTDHGCIQKRQYRSGYNAIGRLGELLVQVRFDRKRVAEMKQRTSQCITIPVLLMTWIVISTSAKAEEYLSRGKRWVRSHPFTLMALSNNEKLLDPSEYRGTGVNTFLVWRFEPELFEAAFEVDRPLGLPWHFHVEEYSLTEHVKARVKNLNVSYPGSTGWLVKDEPQRLAMPGLAEIMEWLRNSYPDNLVYSNAFPAGGVSSKYYGAEPDAPYSYEQYLEDFVNILKPDVLMFDIYPFRGGGVSAAYFKNLENVRSQALKSGIPYWSFVQSWQGGKTSLPSESELRMQIFSSLAYGYTGFAYFTYSPPDVGHRALLDEDGRPNCLYYDAVRVNKEVMNLGQALRFLEGEGGPRYVPYIPGRHLENDQVVNNKFPPGTDPLTDEIGREWDIEDVSVDEGVGLRRDALVGLFKDEKGSRYFMLVNTWCDTGVSARNRQASFTVTFSPDVKMIGRLSRETGSAEQLEVANNTIKITLPGGTGDLFKIGDSDFPGLESRR